METKKIILQEFFVQPRRPFHIRELAQLTKLSHTAVGKNLLELVKDGFIVLKKVTPYDKYVANQASWKFCHSKTSSTIEQIHESGLLEHLEKEFEFPALVLFGSASKGLDDEKSDIDICIISSLTRLPDLARYEKKLHRPVSLHIYNLKQWKDLKVKNPELVNSICNGIVLSGQLEVV